MSEAGKILGIDYGQAKVGLALADLETRMAFAYATFSNDNQLLQKIAEIISKEEVKNVIIGMPFFGESTQATAIEKFADKLMEQTGCPVEFQNEMFTTKSAQQNLIEKGEKRVSKQDDAEAARIILQEWLDKEADGYPTRCS